MELWEIEPQSSRLQGERSTTELQRQYYYIYVKVIYLYHTYLIPNNIANHFG